MTMKRSIEILPDTEAMARRGARIFAGEARQRVRKAGLFTVALAGGSTPRRLHEQLARGVPPGETLPWRTTHIFWGDERHVPPDHPESNYRMALETLLDHVPVPQAHVHRIPSERRRAADAAAEYEETLRAFFKAEPGRPPRLDLILLGMGEDGHTASLFPGSSLLAERERLVAAGTVAKLGTRRISMTLPLLNAARRIVFLVGGSGKAGAVRAALEGAGSSDPPPAALVAPEEGELTWLLDAAAAAGLKDPS